LRRSKKAANSGAVLSFSSKARRAASISKVDVPGSPGRVDAVAIKGADDVTGRIAFCRRAAPLTIPARAARPNSTSRKIFTRAVSHAGLFERNPDFAQNGGNRQVLYQPDSGVISRIFSIVAVHGLGLVVEASVFRRQVQSRVCLVRSPLGRGYSMICVS
jgi:hypothetical protein